MGTSIEPTEHVVDSASVFQLVAVDQPQLEAAQAAMIEWAQRAQRSMSTEIDEETAVLGRAKEAHWALAPHERRIKTLLRRREFYLKIELALNEGYVIIPNFQMTAFAIRTEAKKPKLKVRDGEWHPDEQPQILAAGEGEFKNPDQLIEKSIETRHHNYGAKEAYEQVVSWPSEFKDVIEFPIALAKPLLMQRTAKAIAEKFFDEIGVARDAQPARGDPIIIGRLRNPRSGRPAVSFFIGWYFDPSRL